jgi:hypothetical protein
MSTGSSCLTFFVVLWAPKISQKDLDKTFDTFFLYKSMVIFEDGSCF